MLTFVHNYISYVLDIQVWINPSVPEDLDLVEEDDQFTHMFTLDDATGGEEILNVFKFDPEYEENEKKYGAIKAELLEEEEEGGKDSDSGSGDDDDSSSSDEEEEPAPTAGAGQLTQISGPISGPQGHLGPIKNSATSSRLFASYIRVKSE